ncbi:MAG: hypothetical protein OEM97_01000 [Acidimicrobiia bacterium]|nr:hypothetical protein [Acidimicrobiia bacterium]
MSLLRKFDIRYNSNMAVIGLMLVGFVVGMGLGVADGDIGASLGDGFNLMVTLLLGWSMARELDPDRHGSATAAAVIAGAIWIVMGRSGLLATVAAIAAARILVRSTGRTLTNLDYAFLIGLAFFAGNSVPGWVAGLGLSFSLARDVRLPGSAPAPQRFVAFAVAAAATIGALWRFPSFDPAWSLFAILVVAVGIAAGLIARPSDPRSPMDNRTGPISGERLLSARRTLLVVAIFGALTGSAGVAGLAPLWAALLALPLVDLFPARGTRKLDDSPGDPDVDTTPTHDPMPDAARSFGDEPVHPNPAERSDQPPAD